MATTRITDIIGIAARLSKVPRREIAGKARFTPIVMVRQAVCLLAVETGCHSYSLIGQHLGGRDHSTIMHGERAARAKAERNPEYAHFIERVRQEMEIAEPFLEGWGEQYEFAMLPEPMKPPNCAAPIKHNRLVLVSECEHDDPATKHHAHMASGSAALLRALTA